MAVKHSVAKVPGDTGLASEWNADHAVDNGTIKTQHIESDAVSTTAFAEEIKEFFTSGNMCAITKTFSGVPTLFIASFPIIAGTIVSDQFRCFLRRDGFTIADMCWFTVDQALYFYSMGGSHLHTPPAASCTYDLRIIRDSGTGQIRYAQGRLTIIEFKR